MKQWPVIGVKMPKLKTLEALEAFLVKVENQGFDAVEFSLEMFPFIIDGAVCTRWVEVVKPVLARHPLRYSAHIGRGLDLRNLEDYALHRAVLESSLNVVAALGADLLVLHYEVRTNDNRREQQFIDAHLAAADSAAKLNIMLAVENIEVETVEPLVELMEQTRHPNLKLNLDTGHAYLASRRFHFDFHEAIRLMAPYLVHMHVHDNTGRFEELRIVDRLAYDSLSMPNRREFGRGDIHLPPFFGTIPFGEVFALTRQYAGRYICEYAYEEFEPFNEEVQRQVRACLLASRGVSNSV